MKVGYSKWRNNINLVLGLLWTFYGALKCIGYSEGETFRWFDVLFILIGPLYLGIYIFQKKFGLLTINDEMIEVHGIPKRIIYFKDLKEIRYYAGDYRFKDTSNKEIILPKESLDKKALPVFEEKFQKIKKEFDEKTEAQS